MLPQPSDLILLQSGGLGGPYVSASAWALVQGSTGMVLPQDNSGAGLVSQYASTPLFGPQGFNFYQNLQGGLSTLRNGVAGMWNFDGTTLNFLVSPPGNRGQPIPQWTWALALTQTELSVPGSVSVGRPPCSPLEVATSQWVYDTIAAQIAALLANPVEFGSSVQVDGAAVLKGALTVDGLTTLNGHLDVTCGIDLAGSQTITGDLAVGGNTTLDGNLLVNGCAQFAAGIGLAGDLTTTGNVNIGSQLEVSDAALFDRGIYVEGGATICGSQSLSGALAVGGSMCVNGYAGFENDIGVLGDIDVLGSIAASGDITIAGKTVATKAFVRAAGQVVRSEVAGDIFLATADVLAQVEDRYAPLHSPDFTGMPTAPTPEVGSNDAKLATTAFVQAATAAATAGVATWNDRTGHVRLELSDVVEAGGAALNSPHFTGQPEASDPEAGADSNLIATTHWVNEAINASRATSVLTFNHRVGHVELRVEDIEQAGGAPIRTPTFLGSAHAPTPDEDSHDSNIATTAWVHRAVYDEASDIQKSLKKFKHNYAHHTVWRFNQRSGNVVLRASDLSAAGGALLDSPNFIGIPLAPTAPPQTDTEQIATTAYVDAAIASNPGPPGIAGPQGDPGPPGSGFKIIGTVDTFADLPTTDNLVGDVWLVDDTGDGWVWDGQRWKSIGHIRGATGPEGPPGPLGVVQTTQPDAPTDGMMWWDGSALKMWDGGAWVDITGDYLPLAGGTLTGNLTVGGVISTNNVMYADRLVLNTDLVCRAIVASGNITGPSGAVAIIPGYLPLTGGTLTGNISISGAAPSFYFSPNNTQTWRILGQSTLQVIDVIAGSPRFQISPTGDATFSNKLILPNIPTSDPGVHGALWNNNGVVNISAG